MLNAEYWRDRINTLNGDGIAIKNDIPVYCKLNRCEECDIRKGKKYSNSCNENLIEWLIDEYTGQNIDWTKVPSGTPVYVFNDCDEKVYDRPFMCYLPNEVCKFWAFSGRARLDMANGWKYCKLIKSEDVEKYRRGKC